MQIEEKETNGGEIKEGVKEYILWQYSGRSVVTLKPITLLTRKRNRKAVNTESESGERIDGVVDDSTSKGCDENSSSLDETKQMIITLEAGDMYLLQTHTGAIGARKVIGEHNWIARMESKDDCLLIVSNQKF